MNSIARVSDRVSAAVKPVVEMLEQRQHLTAVTGASFNYLTAPQNVTINFDANVSADLSLDDLVVDNLSSNTSLARANQSLAYNTSTNIATVTFPSESNQNISGMIPDGNFQTIVSETGIPGLSAEYIHDAFFLTADANHDRAVTSADETLVLNNFGTAGNFAQGDLDLDGYIDSDDYTILSANFGRQVPAPITTSNTLTVAALSSSANQLSWTRPQATVDGYRIYRSLDGVNFTQIDDVATTPRSFDDTGLADGMKYWYRVRPYTTAEGNSATTNKDAAVTVLPAPTDLTLSAPAIGGALIAWTTNSTTQTGFTIERCNTSNGTFVAVGTASANATSFTDSTAAENSSYYYRIKAFNSVAASAWTTPQNVTTVAVAAPSDLVAEAISYTTARLTWQNNSSIATIFLIERSTLPDFSTIDQTDKASIDTTEFEAQELDSGVQYYFRVRALNGEGVLDPTSDPSFLAEVALFVPGPGMLYISPFNQQTDTQRKLDWSDTFSNSDNTANGIRTQKTYTFKIERSTSSSFSNPITTTVSGTTNTFTDTLPTTGQYFYRMKTNLVLITTPTGGSATTQDLESFSGTLPVTATTTFQPRITALGNDLKPLAPDNVPATTGGDYPVQSIAGQSHFELIVLRDTPIHVSAVGNSTDPRSSFANIPNGTNPDEYIMAQSQISWNFGDTTASSNYNDLPGFNAAHVYKETGLYTITLSIRRPSMPTVDTATLNIVVVNNYRDDASAGRVLYVASNGNSTNSGTTPSAPLSWNAAISRLRSLTDTSVSSANSPFPYGNVSVLFKQGDKFYATNNGTHDGSFVGFANMSSNSGQALSNIRFGSYYDPASPSLNKPSIVYPDGPTSYNNSSGPGGGQNAENAALFVFSRAGSRFITVENLSFRAPEKLSGTPITTSTSTGRKVFGRTGKVIVLGQGATGANNDEDGRVYSVVNCDFGAVYYFVENPQKSRASGILIQDNANVADNDHPVPVVGRYFYYGAEGATNNSIDAASATGGDDVAIIGNSSGDTFVENHNVREYSSRFLAYRNTFTNFAAGGTRALQQGDNGPGAGGRTEANGHDTLRTNGGNYVWLANNSTFGGQIEIGRYRNGHPLMRYVVIDGNVANHYDQATDAPSNLQSIYAPDETYQSNNNAAEPRMTLGEQGGVSWVRVTNNYIETTRATFSGGIQIKASRSLLSHNTFNSRLVGSTAPAVLRYFNSATRSQLFANLTRRTASSGSSLLRFDGTTNLDIFLPVPGTAAGATNKYQIGGNVWPPSAQFDFGATSVSFSTYSNTGGASNRVAADTQTPVDVFVDAYRRPAPTSVETTVDVPYVAADYWGQTRPTLTGSSTRTAGAVQSTPVAPVTHGFPEFTIIDTGLTLKWSQPLPANAFLGYQLERRTSGGSYSVVATNISSDALYYFDTTVHEDGIYQYRISTLRPGTPAIQYSGVGAFETPLIAVAGTDAPTDAVETDTAIPGFSSSGRRNIVTWVDESANEQGFEIERETWFRGVVTATDNFWVLANVTTLIDDVGEFVTHVYRIRSFNYLGESDWVEAVED